MTTTLTSAKSNGNGTRPAFGVAPGKRRQRRVPTAVAAAAVAVIGALIGVALYGSSMSTTEVLAVARPVAAGQVIGPDDLTVAAVRDDPALHPIPLSQKDSVIGKVATADLAPGSLVVPGETGDGRPLAAGESLVGVEVPSAAAPTGWLRPGDRVQLVSTTKSADGQTGSDVITEARVVAVAANRSSTGALVLSVAVPADKAPTVTAASAGQRVGVVLLGTGQ